MRGQSFAPYRRITGPRWDAERRTLRHVVDSLAFLPEARSSCRLRSGGDQPSAWRRATRDVGATRSGPHGGAVDRSADREHQERRRDGEHVSPSTSDGQRRQDRASALGHVAVRLQNSSSRFLWCSPKYRPGSHHFSARSKAVRRHQQSGSPALSIARVVEPLQKRLRHVWSLPPVVPAARGWTASPHQQNDHMGVGHEASCRGPLVRRLALAGLLIATASGCGSSGRAQTPTAPTATSVTVPPPASHGVVGVDTRTIGKSTRECFLTDVPAGTGPVPSRGIELCGISSSSRLLYNTCSASVKPGMIGYLIERNHGGTWGSSACEQARHVILNAH